MSSVVGTGYLCLQVAQPVRARVELRRVCLVRDSSAKIFVPPRAEVDAALELSVVASDLSKKTRTVVLVSQLLYHHLATVQAVVSLTANDVSRTGFAVGE